MFLILPKCLKNVSINIIHDGIFFQDQSELKEFKKCEFCWF